MTESIGRCYERDGYAAPIRIHDAGGADGARRAFDALEAAEGRERCQIGLLDRHFDQPFIWELATHPAIPESIEWRISAISSAVASRV